MNKFFGLVLSDLKELWKTNKLSIIMVGCLLLLGFLALIPAVEAIIMFALQIVGVGLIAFFGIALVASLVLYIKHTIKRTKL